MGYQESFIGAVNREGNPTKPINFSAINDLQNQNCECELKFLRMGLAAECRILEIEVSFEIGECLPWKCFAKDYVINRNGNEEWNLLG